jgi:ATP-citrate lyase beta-subunit
MAQIAIREYDAKRMFASFQKTVYGGHLIESEIDLDIFDKLELDSTKRWVIKPDQLFGKRGKYGLLGVKFDNANIRKWWWDHYQKKVTIGKQIGELDTFLIEPFVAHDLEYYVAIKTEKDHDVIYFSHAGGIEVEENWEQVESINIPLNSEWNIRELLMKWFHNIDEKVIHFMDDLYRFFVSYGFAYLEVNPFTFDGDDNVICLDMVARVDDSESFKQRLNWDGLVFPHPFGPSKTEGEKYIEKLDSETGASLKFRILNPDGRIWLLTSGGWASVIIADTLADLGFATEIGNYWECSWNPDRENTKAYTTVLLDTMLANKISWKYLLIAWAIANFTHIDKTFSGIIDAFHDRIEDMKAQNIQILVRRWGINDTKWLEMMKRACRELGLPCEIADGSVYMTDILRSIHLS